LSDRLAPKSAILNELECHNGYLFCVIILKASHLKATSSVCS